MAPFSSLFKKILSYPILQNSLKTLFFFILTKILLYHILWTPPPFISYKPISYYLLHLTHLYLTNFYILHIYFLPPFTSYIPTPYHLLPKNLEFCLNPILILNHQNPAQITSQMDSLLVIFPIMQY